MTTLQQHRTIAPQ
uniref:Uncharacterized protein n=1 Tax=Anguilla anguilla TaxID=7936 RepID=A0A0E9P915_ANGAN